MTAPTITYGHGSLLDWYVIPYVQSGTCTDNKLVTTTEDTVNLTQANDYWNGHFIKYLTGDNAGVTKEITDFDNATNLATHDAFANTTSTGDKFEITTFNITEDGQTFSPPTIYNGSFLKIEATASGGNKDGYVSYPSEATGHTGELNLSSVVYPKLKVRYFTEDTTVQAAITLVFDDAATQAIMTQRDSLTPTVETFDITTSKTIDHIRFHCEESDQYVCFDFSLIYKGAFTFPQYSTVNLHGANVYGDVLALEHIPGYGDFLGGQQSDITVSGNIDHQRAGWKRTGDDLAGQVFQDLLNNAAHEDWQWFTSDLCSLKTTLRDFNLTESPDQPFKYAYDVLLKEYSRAGKQEEYDYSRFGTDL